MTKIEKQLRKLTLASIGMVAKGVDRVSDFFDGKEDERFDGWVERGQQVVDEGREENRELRHKIGQRIDKFRDDHCEKKTVDVESMTKEERAELLKKLQALEEDK